MKFRKFGNLAKSKVEQKRIEASLSVQRDSLGRLEKLRDVEIESLSSFNPLKRANERSYF